MSEWVGFNHIVSENIAIRLSVCVELCRHDSMLRARCSSMRLTRYVHGEARRTNTRPVAVSSQRCWYRWTVNIAAALSCCRLFSIMFCLYSVLFFLVLWHCWLGFKKIKWWSVADDGVAEASNVIEFQLVPQPSPKSCSWNSVYVLQIC